MAARLIYFIKIDDMTDVLLEVFSAIFTGIILSVLAYYMGVKHVDKQPGSKLILIGFSLFFFGMVIDITDNFPELNYLVVVGDTETEAFLEKVIGTVLGLFLISIGFYKWLPSIMELKNTQTKLVKLNDELDERVVERTCELEITTVRLKDEIRIRKQTEEKLKQQALFDGLTNLPNRTLSLDRLSQLLNKSQRDNKKAAVMFLDLDDFKKVNDTLGHETGDKLLISAADRLKAEVRTGDTVGRLGGDEFIILLGGLSDTTDIGHVAENLLRQFRNPFNIDGRQLILTVSVGISIFPEDSVQASLLLRNADSAMYHSKEIGRNTYSYFTDQMNHEVSRRLLLEEQMHGALERNEFTVFYQPKIDLSSNLIMGTEALLRWHNPVLGDISPIEFIPIAEQTGLIVSLGQFVLNKALSATSIWRNYDSNFTISVNLSPRQFRDPEFLNYVEKAINRFCPSECYLEFEITEGVFISGFGDIDHVLCRLNNLGVIISMDDFGTGYSSLSYLRRYPFDVLKIDRSFVDDIMTSQSDRELINATVAMAKGLNLKVVAEGVETIEQLAYLKGIGCNYAQGYLFSKPVPENEIQKLIDSEFGKLAIISDQHKTLEMRA